VVVTAKVGDQGRLYGSITSADIAEQLSTLIGQPFDRRMIQLDEPIRQLGSFDVPVRLHRSVSTKLKVNVQAAR
jgi:large subunit ribosomal protein L9